MNSAFRRFLAFALMLGLSSSGIAATIVKLETPLGAMTFALYDDAKPITTANFLNYITSGLYEGSFAHRLPQGFVLQGGGYTTDGNSIFEVPTNAPIVNEAGPFPVYSNVQGTLAMAKVGGDPNSATSQWFLNLGNNSANLDNQNGGFTVFGALIDGLGVLQQFAAFAPQSAATQSNVIVNVGSPFTELPVTRVTNNKVSIADFVTTRWSVVPEPGPAALLLIGGGAILWRRRGRMFR